MEHLSLWLKKNENIGFVLLRFFIGIRLIYGVIDNIISWEKMLEFKSFLAALHFPMPLASAVLSVYAQMFAGVSFIIGWKVRYAAFLMVINFTIALLAAHWGQSFEEITSPLALLFISILILFSGNKLKGAD
jgi:putative oxidoreductase